MSKAARRRYNIKRKLFDAQNGRCWLCGKIMTLYEFGFAPAGRPPPNYATIDHVVPKSKGGPNGKANYRLAHEDCNRSRGNAETATR